MKLSVDPSSVKDYETFMRVKALPQYRVVGRSLEFPDEYADMVCGDRPTSDHASYVPIPGLFDYQRDITTMAIRKRKFALFIEPGLGKTLMQTEFARHAAAQLPANKCVMMIAPLMVVPQTLEEVGKFYGDRFKVEQVRAGELSSWLTSGTSRVGITNYEALRDETPAGRIGAMVLDESSVLKSAYGKWGQTCIRLGRGLEWKLAATGTPAPNDRIEFANHAVFLDHFPTVNSFLAKFFINRGQTDNRWDLKPHALKPFYTALSHWCIFVNNPATYGWKDNAGTLPPIHVHIEDVPLTPEQKGLAMDISGKLAIDDLGGITTRSQLGQISKGHWNGKDIPTYKPARIIQLLESFGGESTIIWCIYNAEQEALEDLLPGALSISGATPHDERAEMIRKFKAGENRVMITKPDILGFGLNLQVCTRQIFSGLQDSYEMFYQAVKRSNRVGSTKPLHVYIPVTELERPMVDTVLRKAHRVDSDAREQEAIFKSIGMDRSEDVNR